jgi:hypothetical protein
VDKNKKAARALNFVVNSSQSLGWQAFQPTPPETHYHTAFQQNDPNS